MIVKEEKEGKMAKFDAKEIAEDAAAVFKMIDSDMDLPEWLEAKITKAADYMNSVKDYLTHHMQVNEKRGTCWVGYKQVGMKKKGDRLVPNCVAEVYWENNLGESCGYTIELDNSIALQEAEYQGRKVKLGKIMQGDVKKFKVYVKNPKGNVVKVNFGQGGDAKGGTMRIRKSNPKARKAFRARHNCDSPGPRHKARYWSCRKW
tara:strand:- start:2423 stop:3034 length:612 start_codon:yes stop_codon:yes gene_type:complete